MSATVVGGGSRTAAGSHLRAETVTPYLALAGRVLLSAIFLTSGVNKLTNWSGTAEHMAGEGMVAVPLMLAGAVAVELFGGAAILLGCYTRAAALVVAGFLVPATLVFHDFWTAPAADRMNQVQHFMKNLTIIGGLLVLAAFGAGRFALDARAPEPRPRVAPLLVP